MITGESLISTGSSSHQRFFCILQGRARDYHRCVISSSSSCQESSIIPRNMAMSMLATQRYANHSQSTGAHTDARSQTLLLHDAKPGKILWTAKSCRQNTNLGGRGPRVTICNLGSAVQRLHWCKTPFLVWQNEREEK